MVTRDQQPLGRVGHRRWGVRGHARDQAGEGVREGGPHDAEQAAPADRGPQHRGLHDGEEQRHDLLQGPCGLVGAKCNFPKRMRVSSLVYTSHQKKNPNPFRAGGLELGLSCVTACRDSRVHGAPNSQPKRTRVVDFAVLLRQLYDTWCCQYLALGVFRRLPRKAGVFVYSGHNPFAAAANNYATSYIPNTLRAYNMYEYGRGFIAFCCCLFFV